MKKIVLYYQRNRSLERVMINNPEVFAEKPEITAAIEKFTANNNRSGDLLADLARPRSIIFLPKSGQERNLRRELSRMAGIGILMATRQNDAPKAAMYMEYKRNASEGTCWILSQKSMQVADGLAGEDEEMAASIGLTTKNLQDFKTMALEFSVTLETTDLLKKQRTANRQELNTLMAENLDILQLQFDPFANFVQVLFPSYFREYKIARRSPLPRKANAKPAEEITELSGTATNSTTGEPVAGATVMVTELNLVVTTDEDGYYLFDEVPVGSFTVSCHAPGYKLPEIVPVSITGTEPLQLNFELEPEVGEQAA